MFYTYVDAMEAATGWLREAILDSYFEATVPMA